MALVKIARAIHTCTKVQVQRTNVQFSTDRLLGNLHSLNER
jgi:hypothetical protein